MFIPHGKLRKTHFFPHLISDMILQPKFIEPDVLNQKHPVLWTFIQSDSSERIGSEYEFDPVVGHGGSKHSGWLIYAKKIKQFQLFRARKA